MRLLIGLIIIGVMSCDNTTDKAKTNDTSDKSLLDEVTKNTDLRGTLDRFQFPFGDSLKTSSNQLIFFVQNSWDTSFVLMLERRPETIKVVYYETTPNYHLNKPYMDDEINLTYFDGFSFKTDTTKWNSIINESNKILELKDSLENVRQLDGSSYALSHNSKVKLCCDPYNPNLMGQFKKLESFIKSNLIRDVYKRKLDIGQQADRDMKKEKE